MTGSILLSHYLFRAAFNYTLATAFWGQARR
jgi:hypothetical protein